MTQENHITNKRKFKYLMIEKRAPDRNKRPYNIWMLG